VDITSYVLEFEINRGFPGELDTVADAGTATIVLDNRDRRFDPSYAAGPYFGNLKPGKQVRIRVTYSPTWPGVREKNDSLSQTAQRRHPY
jgi:hypothetical protein